MVINLSPKEFPNWVTCPQVQVFSLIINYKYLLTKFILFPCSVKYDTWAPSMHWSWIMIPSHSSLLHSRDALNSITTLFPLPGISNLVTALPMYIHNIHHIPETFSARNALTAHPHMNEKRIGSCNVC